MPMNNIESAKKIVSKQFGSNYKKVYKSLVDGDVYGFEYLDEDVDSLALVNSSTGEVALVDGIPKDIYLKVLKEVDVKGG
jgi:hypothetical protein